MIKYLLPLLLLTALPLSAFADYTPTLKDLVAYGNPMDGYSLGVNMEGVVFHVKVVGCDKVGFSSTFVGCMQKNNWTIIGDLVGAQFKVTGDMGYQELATEVQLRADVHATLRPGPNSESILEIK